MRIIRLGKGSAVVVAALSLACGGDSSEFPSLGDPVGLRYDASAKPTDDELRTFNGPYRLEVQLSPRCSTLPLQVLRFDVSFARNLENYPQGYFAAPSWRASDDAGFVLLRPDGLSLSFAGAAPLGTQYVVVSTWMVAREGDFTVVNGRGRFSGKMELPNLSLVRPSPPAPAADFGLWECDALDHAVTLLPR